jgi:plasmid replication initiation protein
MQTFLNTNIDEELANALTEYTNQSNQPKNAVISIGLLQIIPQHILDKYNVVEVLKEKGVLASIEDVGFIGFRNKYAGKVYDLLHPHIKEGNFRISIDDFKEYMQFDEEQYALFGTIKLRVIDPVIKEINKKTRLQITYEAEKTGRNITSLFFKIGE